FLWRKFSILWVETKHSDKGGFLLCNVFKAATGVLRNEKNKPQLKDAIYGAKGGTKFRDDGSIETRGNCVGTLSGRSVLCDYHKNSGRVGLGLGKNGCFAESLVGTFFCVCTPGDESTQGLCGLKEFGSVGTWSGRFSGIKLNETLFKDVWKKLNKTCNDDSEGEQDYKKQLENLKTATEAVRKRIERSHVSGFFLLGQGTSFPCSGETNKNICAAYQAKGGKPYVPWLDKIELVLRDLIDATAYINSAPALEAPRPGTTEQNRENEEAALVMQIGENEEAQGPTVRFPHIQMETDNQTGDKTEKGGLTGNKGGYSRESTQRKERKPQNFQKKKQYSASCNRHQRRRLFPNTSYSATLISLAQLTNMQSTHNIPTDASL
ncbi:Variant surface glycoprotein, partial [Trypanosoma congolense IL3000]